MATIKATKALLRKEIKEKLAKLSAEEKQKQSGIVANKLFATPAFLNSNRISVYLSTDGEIDTEPIVRKIFELNKQCFVPRYDGDVMQMVSLHSMQDWETLPLTKWQIKQPRLKDQRDNAMETGGLDLVILPGVAFTKDGWRMGHGKGYYDSFLSKLFKSQERRPATVAVCFSEQIMESIPTHEHDVKIDTILYTD